MNLSAVINLQLVMFALFICGFILTRKGVINSERRKGMSDLLIDLFLPANIICAFLTGISRDVFAEAFQVLVIALGIQIISYLLGLVLYRKEVNGRRMVLRYATICSNAGFLGNPIAEGIYGMEGLVLASVYLIPQRIMMWSSGLAVFSGSSDKIKTLKKVVTHPCILACVLGMIMMVTGAQLPPGLDGAVTSVGNCNTAMSMMVIGMILADIDLKDFWDWTVVKYTVHRLVIIPAVVYLVCRMLPLSKTVLGLCVLLAAMPAGATTSILAEKYQVDSPFATKMVIFSTLLSLPTICLWSIFLQ